LQGSKNTTSKRYIDSHTALKQKMAEYKLSSKNQERNKNNLTENDVQKINNKLGALLKFNKDTFGDHVANYTSVLETYFDESVVNAYTHARNEAIYEDEPSSDNEKI
jgi:hypothetical protein